MAHIAQVACPHDCPDSCLMDVTIDHGKAVKVTASKEHRHLDETDRPRRGRNVLRLPGSSSEE